LHECLELEAAAPARNVAFRVFSKVMFRDG